MTNKPQEFYKVDVFFKTYSVYIIWGGKENCYSLIDGYFKEYIDETGIEIADFEKNLGKTFYRHGIDPVIWISSDLQTVIDAVPIFAHETHHALDYIFDYIGETSKDEIFAMCLENLIRQFTLIYS